VGAGAGAVTALRSGQIDAIANLDPVISTLVKEDAIRIIADTRALDDAQKIFGGNMPSGCLYTAQAFIDAHPNTTQALANAMVRADKWIQASSVDDIAKLVPESYLLGDPDLYKLALKGNREGLSPDGLVPEDGPQTALNALAEFVPNFDRTAIDISRIWTNQFATRANQKYPHA
jgi:NitT/TauT family transport system substrate-binding protein